MKFLLILILIFYLCGCTPTNEKTEIEDTANSPVEEVVSFITYEDAFSYVKDCEDAIIKSNAYNGVNKHGESAAEKIVYSDEYASLYCALWSALEEIGKPDDDRYSKSKLRWQLDFTNEEWKKQLIEAFNEGGEDAFFSKYADIYSEEVFPVVHKKWKDEQ